MTNYLLLRVLIIGSILTTLNTTHCSQTLEKTCSTVTNSKTNLVQFSELLDSMIESNIITHDSTLFIIESELAVVEWTIKGDKPCCNRMMINNNWIEIAITLPTTHRYSGWNKLSCKEDTLLAYYTGPPALVKDIIQCINKKQIKYDHAHKKSPIMELAIDANDEKMVLFLIRHHSSDTLQRLLTSVLMNLLMKQYCHMTVIKYIHARNTYLVATAKTASLNSSHVPLEKKAEKLQLTQELLESCIKKHPKVVWCLRDFWCLRDLMKLVKDNRLEDTQCPKSIKILENILSLFMSIDSAETVDLEKLDHKRRELNRRYFNICSQKNLPKVINQKLQKCLNNTQKDDIFRELETYLSDTIDKNPFIFEELLPEKLRFIQPLQNAYKIKNDKERQRHFTEIVNSRLDDNHIRTDQDRLVFTCDSNVILDKTAREYYLTETIVPCTIEINILHTSSQYEKFATILVAAGANLSAIKKQYSIIKKLLLKGLYYIEKMDIGKEEDIRNTYLLFSRDCHQYSFVYANKLPQRLQYIQSLFKAVKDKDVKKVHIILHIQPDLPLGLQNNNGETLLHIAMRNRDKEMIKALLGYSTQHVDKGNYESKSFIECALDYHTGSIDMLEFCTHLATHKLQDEYTKM